MGTDGILIKQRVLKKCVNKACLSWAVASPTQSETKGELDQDEMQGSGGHHCIHNHANRAAELPQGTADPCVHPPRKQGHAQQQEHQRCQGANHCTF